MRLSDVVVVAVMLFLPSFVVNPLLPLLAQSQRAEAPAAPGKNLILLLLSLVYFELFFVLCMFVV